MTSRNPNYGGDESEDEVDEEVLDNDDENNDLHHHHHHHHPANNTSALRVVDHYWNSYFQNKSYMKLSAALLDASLPKSFGVRDDIYHFWFVELLQELDCDKRSRGGGGGELTSTAAAAAAYVPMPYVSGKHSQGAQPALDKCFERLNQSDEYTHITEMFLTEYENCMEMAENNSMLRNFFNTFCLDTIAVRRLVIEYQLCCLKSNETGNADEDELVNSTLCDVRDFNTELFDYDVAKLVNLTKEMSTAEVVPAGANDTQGSQRQQPNENNEQLTTQSGAELVHLLKSSDQNGRNPTTEIATPLISSSTRVLDQTNMRQSVNRLVVIIFVLTSFFSTRI